MKNQYGSGCNCCLFYIRKEKLGSNLEIWMQRLQTECYKVVALETAKRMNIHHCNCIFHAKNTSHLKSYNLKKNGTLNKNN